MVTLIFILLGLLDLIIDRVIPPEHKEPLLYPNKHKPKWRN
jgi:hypothetical protein